MRQARIDENGVVTDVNDWDEGVGIPCDESVRIGMIWTGVSFARSQADIVREYDEALVELFESTARSRRYDSRVTCALRAGFPGPFRAEGLAFAQWMDACNMQAYGIMADVMAGRAELPTIDAFIASMPTINWPA